MSGPSPFLPGWPVKLGIINTELLPVVGEGVTGSPAIGAGDLRERRQRPEGRRRGQRRARHTSSTPTARRATARRGGHNNAMQTDFAAGTDEVRHAGDPGRRATRPSATSGGASPSFLTPAAGVLRALDLGVNEYQGGQDFVAAYDTPPASSGPDSRAS